MLKTELFVYSENYTGLEGSLVYEEKQGNEIGFAQVAAGCTDALAPCNYEQEVGENAANDVSDVICDH